MLLPDLCLERVPLFRAPGGAGLSTSRDVNKVDARAATGCSANYPLPLLDQIRMRRADAGRSPT